MLIPYWHHYEMSAVSTASPVLKDDLGMGCGAESNSIMIGPLLTTTLSSLLVSVKRKERDRHITESHDYVIPTDNTYILGVSKCVLKRTETTIEWKLSIKSFITDHGWSPKRKSEFRGEVVSTLQLSLRCIVSFCSPFSNLQVGFAHVSQDCPQICTAEIVARRGTNTCQ